MWVVERVERGHQATEPVGSVHRVEVQALDGDLVRCCSSVASHTSPDGPAPRSPSTE